MQRASGVEDLEGFAFRLSVKGWGLFSFFPRLSRLPLRVPVPK